VVDSFVLLTPVVVLAVVLLLGFAGCDLVFGLDPPKSLKLEVAVPSALVVEVSRFRYTLPGTTTVVVETVLDRTDVSPDVFVLSHLVTGRDNGTWTVNCRLDVKDAAGTASDAANGDFVVDDDTPGIATARFEATGSPATGDFRVRFVGLIAEE
jgi:hypothetical protein